MKCGSIECKYWRRRWHTSLTMEIIIFLSKKEKSLIGKCAKSDSYLFKNQPTPYGEVCLFIF